MKQLRIEVTAKFYVNVPIPYIKDLESNNDTYKDFKEEFDIEIGNNALSVISDNYKGQFEEIQIVKTKPYDESILEYNDILKDERIKYKHRVRE